MITLDDIKSQWAEDSKLDNDLLDNESTKIPQLHSKYLNYLSDVRLITIRKEQEYKTLIREKFEYYTGKADDVVYQENPFDLKVLKHRFYQQRSAPRAPLLLVFLFYLWYNSKSLRFRQKGKPCAYAPTALAFILYHIILHYTILHHTI